MDNTIGDATPTQDERTMAVLAHALQMVGGFIAPLVIFLVKRKSKFVSFHALQALLLQICYLVVVVGIMMVWFAVMFGTILSHAGQPSNQPPVAIFIFFPLFWLAVMAMWAVMLTLVIVYSIKAGRGEWAAYPIIGGWARRILKI
jgi:uncharacterized protein